MNEAADTFRDATILTVQVDPRRLAWGHYDHARNRETGEGDIAASYSADTIATAGRVRKAFRWQADLMVAVSLATRDGSPAAEAYCLTPAKLFKGTPTSYHTKTGTAEGAEAARNDPDGFYHGMTVRHGKENVVLTGPPLTFVAAVRPGQPATHEQYEQLSLF